ncbi:MAG: hypothetical protein JOZ35_11610 [Hyphomicrobiales bacterium]|jgi:hypothetical protein|nr:hypothetical protein [Hyphomicrobiales bacterium]MBV8287558.1 hypothetical protein [Hyphomicrobiales bacterium]MBV8320964.1 hypothetical protein [Hyphomicrobiales bacterium]MBV8423539.1 hypothetical protein [Hyphomicrobiales bacterium]
MASTAEDCWRYNLLAERINELGAIWSAACRADPEFRSTWRVCEKLQQAGSFLTSWHLGMATQCCEEAERLFLTERRWLQERRSPPFNRLEARLHHAFGTPIVWHNGAEGHVGMTDELKAAWDALEDFEYERAERLAVRAERKARAIVLKAERAARRSQVEVSR